VISGSVYHAPAAVEAQKTPATNTTTNTPPNGAKK